MTEAALGIDIGGTFTKIGLVAGRRLKSFMQVPTLGPKGPESLISRLPDSIRKLGTSSIKLKAVGLDIAGDIDSEKGILRFSPNLRGWEGFPLARRVSELAKCPVFMENDANAAVWGAYMTRLQGKPRNAIGLTLGTGVGGGLIIEGNLYRGSTGSSGEIGHVVVETGGALCHCGQRGCLEAYAGSYGIRREAVNLLKANPLQGKILRALCPDSSRIEPKHIAVAAARGDSLSREIWRRTARRLAAGITEAVLIVNPEAVLILGGISKAGKWLLDPLRDILRAQPFRASFSRLRLVAGAQTHMGCVGAALLAVERSR